MTGKTSPSHHKQLDHKPDTLSEAIVELHDALKSDIHDSLTPCFMENSQLGKFFRLFSQRRWPRGTCECFSKVQGPPQLDHESRGWNSYHYVKCRHLTRWERAHSSILQQVYPHVRSLSSFSSTPERGFVSYDKFLLHAFASSAPCSCNDLVENVAYPISSA